MSTYTEKHREYYRRNRERILAVRRERERQWLSTPAGKYSVQKRHAKQRGIPWEFTFESWMEMWEQSGKWTERGQATYVMCRKGDRGPYSPSNCRIDTASANASERNAWMNRDSNGRFLGED